MDSTAAAEYLHVVEWSFSPSLVLHTLQVNDGVSTEDFERFMEIEALPKLGQLKTRTGAIVSQKLLVETTGTPPVRYDSLDLDLRDLATRTSVRRYRIVADHGS